MKACHLQNKTNLKNKDGDDDDEDEPEATLDPEEVRVRIDAIKKLFDKVQKNAKRYGRHDAKTEKVQIETE